MPKKTIILGIDPGIADTGFGVIEKKGNELKAIDYGSITTKANLPTEDRLAEIYDGLNKLIKKYKPEVVSVEKLFFAKNVKTAMEVSQARGVVMLIIGQKKLLAREYTPLQIKQALTGHGKADKKQMQQMIKIVLGLKTPPKSDDAADALAAAICCSNSLPRSK